MKLAHKVMPFLSKKSRKGLPSQAAGKRAPKRMVADDLESARQDDTDHEYALGGTGN